MEWRFRIVLHLQLNVFRHRPSKQLFCDGERKIDSRCPPSPGDTVAISYDTLPYRRRADQAQMIPRSPISPRATFLS